jgi:hypothetical protein
MSQLRDVVMLGAGGAFVWLIRPRTLPRRPDPNRYDPTGSELELVWSGSDGYEDDLGEQVNEGYLVFQDDSAVAYITRTDHDLAAPWQLTPYEGQYTYTFEGATPQAAVAQYLEAVR